MNFNEALKILGITKYAKRIWSSNSHGELFHLMDYINMAEAMKKGDIVTKEIFAPAFEDIVKQAEKNWSRPESVFQHIPKIISG